MQKMGLKEEAKRNRIKQHKQSSPSSVCFPSGWWWWWWVTVARINTCLHGSYISCSTPHPSTGPHKRRNSTANCVFAGTYGIRCIVNGIGHSAENRLMECFKKTFFCPQPNKYNPSYWREEQCSAVLCS